MMQVEDKLAFISKQLRDNEFHVIGFLLTKDYILIKAIKLREYYYLVIPRVLGEKSINTIDKILRYNTINNNKLPYGSNEF
ncbi:MAG: hypothetical protein M1128_03330 [Candidatus Marsarchaeota archaeon]|nr:hypothetical protein [Candidatus Marsarchaeota archaeon]